MAIIFTLKKVAANRKEVCGLWLIFFLQIQRKTWRKGESWSRRKGKKMGESAWAVKICEKWGKERGKWEFSRKKLTFEPHHKWHRKAVNKSDEKKYIFLLWGQNLKSKAGEEDGISVVTNYRASQSPVKTNSFCDHFSIWNPSSILGLAG